MTTTLERDCVIAGGGPAGMVLGYLLARASLRVSVLEKHEDFLRDFRGDTIHPSTLTVLGELGLRERFLELPLSRVNSLDVVLDGERFTMVDFTTLPPPDNFLVFAPQWDFLNFLAGEAAKLPGFDLRMSTEALDLIRKDGRVVGVSANGPDGDLEIRATLTVAADGRGSRLRDAMGMSPVEVGVPIDVLWFHLPKPSGRVPSTLGYFSQAGMILTLDRGDYYQAGSVIPKGTFEALKAAGLPAFRTRLAAVAPHLTEPSKSLTDWAQVKLLTVQVNHLERWHQPGIIAIGDAAHAMSPMFGVGINYAVQDAVALANAITPHLAGGAAPDEVLAQVQARREAPARKMQRLQTLGHRAIARAQNRGRFAPRPLVRLLRALSPLLRRFTARLIGLGFRPEHPNVR